MDAPPWDSGARFPSIGVFVLAVDHSAIGPGFPARVEAHLERLAGAGVRLPRSRPTEPPALPTGSLALSGDVLAVLRRRANPTTPASGQERPS